MKIEVYIYSTLPKNIWTIMVFSVSPINVFCHPFFTANYL